MAVRIFHGGCHNCESQEQHGLYRCRGCRYFKAEWKKPNLYLPKKKDLMKIIDESFSAFQQSKQVNGRYKEEPKITKLEDGTYMARNDYGHVYYKAKSMRELEAILDLRWSPNKCRSDIADQLRNGCPVSLEFLESYGKDYLEELRTHPEYSGFIKDLIIENGLHELHPADAQEMFLF